jgi:hypothetical protein
MKISQRAYFAIRSETFTAADITAFLDTSPDEIMVLGSKRTQPPVPVIHSWSLHCRDRGLMLDAQIGTILARIEPLHPRLQDLVARQDVDLVLAIVRFFGDEDGEDGEEESLETVIAEGGAVLERLAGQHQLLGWHLTHEQLGFLASIRCSIDADEYG